MLFPGCDAHRKRPRRGAHSGAGRMRFIRCRGSGGCRQSSSAGRRRRGDAVGHLAVVEQWVRANEQHPETYVSRCCFLVGAGGLREPRRKGARVAAPSGCIVPWAARASCWPQPQQLLPVSAAGSGRRCCTGAFFPAGLFGGSMLFSSTLVVRYKVQIKQKLQRHNNAGVLGGAKQPKSEPLPSGASLAAISSKVMVFVPSL